MSAEHRANGVSWPQYELAAAFARKSSLGSSWSDTVGVWERRLSEGVDKIFLPSQGFVSQACPLESRDSLEIQAGVHSYHKDAELATTSRKTTHLAMCGTAGFNK